MLRFLLNVLWFAPGGVVMGLGWWLAGLVAAIPIVPGLLCDRQLLLLAVWE